MSTFIAFIAAVFSIFRQFEHLKLSLIIEKIIWNIIELISFSYGHEESRTGFTSIQSTLSKSHVKNA